MADEWYCSIAGKESGPLSAQQLKEMTKRGFLAPDDLVRMGAAGAWFPAGRVKGLFAAAGTPVSSSGASGAGRNAPLSVPVAKPLQTPPANPAPPVQPPPAQAPPVQVRRAPASPIQAPSIPVPAVQVPPVPVVTPALGQPVAADFSFLEEEAAAPPRHPHPAGRSTPPAHASHGAPGASALEELKARKDQRRKQVLVVWTLVGVLAGVTALAVAVSIYVSRPAPEKPKASDSRATVGQTDADQKSPELAGGKGAPGESKAAEKAATAEKDEGKWSSAKSPVSVESVELRISSAVIGRPKGLPLPVRPGKPKPHFLVVTLDLTNKSEKKKIDHAGWSSGTVAGMAVRLEDDAGNRYALKSALAGREGPEAIYPGKSIEDKLVFERPIDSAKFLRLQLPASAFGGKGTIKLEIPMDMIKESADEGEPGEPPVRAKSGSKPEANPEPGAAPAARKGDDGEDAPTGDPRVDFGIKTDEDKPPKKSKEEGTGSKPSKTSGKNKAAEDEDSDFGFKKASKQKAGF